jgi:hypothetical protein
MAAKVDLIQDGEALARAEAATGVVAASKVAVPSKAVASKTGALVLRMDDKTWATPVAAMAMVLLVVASKGTL